MTIENYIKTFKVFGKGFVYKEAILEHCSEENNVNFPHIYHTIQEFDFILSIDENNEEVKKIKELLCLNAQEIESGIEQKKGISVRAWCNMIHLFIALIYISKHKWDEFCEDKKHREVVIGFDSIQKKKKLVLVSNGYLKFAYI